MLSYLFLITQKLLNLVGKGLMYYSELPNSPSKLKTWRRTDMEFVTNGTCVKYFWVWVKFLRIKAKNYLFCELVKFRCSLPKIKLIGVLRDTARVPQPPNDPPTLHRISLHGLARIDQKCQFWSFLGKKSFFLLEKSKVLLST